MELRRVQARVWVDPDWRGMGVGRGLMEKVRQWAIDSGYKKLWLKVAEGNTGAIKLYEGMGFVHTGERGGMKRDRSISMITMASPL